MQLKGTFDVTDARFTHEKMKDAINELSRRGQGKPNDTSIDNVAAQFRGDFKLRNSTITFRGCSLRRRGSRRR